MRGKYIIYTPDYITIQHSLSLTVVVLPLTFQWRVPSVFLNRSLELGLSELEFEYLKQIEDTSFPALSVSFLTGKYRTSSSRAQQVGAESRGQPLQWPTQSQTTQACTLPVLPSWVWVNKRKWRTALTRVGGKSIVASIWLVLPLTAPLDYFVRGTWHIMGRARSVWQRTDICGQQRKRIIDLKRAWKWMLPAPDQGRHHCPGAAWPLPCLTGVPEAEALG